MNESPAPPIRFEPAPPKNLLVVTFQGVVNETDLFSAYRARIEANQYHLFPNILVDLRAVESTDMTGESVRRLVQLLSIPGEQGIKARVAIVASEAYIFGMARMYEIMHTGTTENIRVFRHLNEAEEWLGIG
jgi:hypothetical protein